MQKLGPIIVVEDDLDDQEMLAEAFKAANCNREVKFFADGDEALKFIESNDNAPFLILSDVNMPRINGFELRSKVRNSAKLSARIIPYLFLTTGAQKEAVEGAYADSAQGFFIKPSSLRELKSIVMKILDYWEECYSPQHKQVNRTFIPAGQR
jgi:CheY-like chemotaxis protein